MLVKGGEGPLGWDFGMKPFKVLVQTVSGKNAAVQVEAIIDIIFLPYTVLESWLQ